MSGNPANAGEIQDRDDAGRFKAGQSGNPEGKRPGTRHKATQAALALLGGEAEELTRKCIELAKGGDVQALRLCLERLCPVRREAPISLDLPELADVADLPKIMGAVLAAVARGDITPSEGERIAGLIGGFGKAYELADFEQRLQTLEKALEAKA